MTPPIDLGWTLQEITDAVGGRLVGDGSLSVSSVNTDTRDVLDGALFVALVGETFDGHSFTSNAIDGGATAVLVEEVAGCDAVPRVEVASTLDALLSLAAKRRSEISAPVVAITGSAGKTSTKDLIAAGMRDSWASPRSFNNEIGVPLTILATPNDATAVVVEVGSRGRGHIASLAKAVRPDVAVVTNLGVVHLETFGSTEILADAKYELVEMLHSEGTAVLPDDESRLHRTQNPGTITFGAGPHAQIRIGAVSMNGEGYPSFDLMADGRSYPVSLSVAGSHQASNAAAAVGAAVSLGLDIESFISGMEHATGSAWRMDIHRGSFTVVNDSYNANPQSVASALATLADMDGGRRIAVLGPMAELGSVCEDEHRKMGEVATEVGLDAVVVIGPDHGYGLGAPQLVRNATDLEEAADTLHDILEPGDVVLVKASRSAGLERLALALIEEATT
ncbi:MAG: UDP-N-acetylmuramoyl-tripeptide--D-alanyl-D-alanine ligase [Acidimicrobiia bacterium]